MTLKITGTGTLMASAALLAAMMLSACGQPIRLQIVDAASGKPLADARVAHYRKQLDTPLLGGTALDDIGADSDGRVIVPYVRGGESLYVSTGSEGPRYDPRFTRAELRIKGGKLEMQQTDGRGQKGKEVKILEPQPYSMVSGEVVKEFRVPLPETPRK